MQFVVLLAFVTLATWLGGCAKSVDVASDFPQPLMPAYPLVVAVRFPTDLTGFTHVEDPSQEPEWTIHLGKANLQMFRALFTGMFGQLIELTDGAEVPAGTHIDLLIEPSLEELEFSSPSQSGSEQYTVWLHYNLRLFLPDGQLLGDWRITAYGEEDEGSMGMGSADAMNDAAVTALRDAAANIVIGFETAPGIQERVLPHSGNTDNSENTDTDVAFSSEDI